MSFVYKIGMIKIKISIILFCLFAFLPFAHGACLEGDCQNGKGAFSWDDGTKYEGTFKDGKMHGQGTWTKTDGSKYVGEFKNHYFNGQGKWTAANGAVYIGELKDGKFNGKGTWTTTDGSKYVGDFKDGAFTGQGTWTIPGGHRYVGEFKDGAKHGYGNWSWANGDRYEGGFRDDKYEGRGKLIWADGIIYEGTFIDGIPRPPYELLLPDNTRQSGKINSVVKIVGIAENSQAQSIGLQKGDIIIEYNKETVLNEKMMLHLVSQAKPEENINMLIRRAGKYLKLSLKGGRIGITIQRYFAYEIEPTAQKTISTAPLKPDRENETAVQLEPPAQADFGKYYALIIGNNNYSSLPKLKTARNDAQKVASILKNNYGFEVILLLDAKRSDILVMVAKLRGKLTNSDNLLLYYAGHGFLDKDGDEGYWLPVDATKDNEINWIANSFITTQLKAMEAKHILIIADSCYSGKLGRDVHIVKRTPDYYSRIAQKKARSVIASGGLEPVIDSGGKGNHSVFTSALIAALQENKAIIDTSELFNKIRRPVVLNADQTPEYADIRKAGHEGGEFIFIRGK